LAAINAAWQRLQDTVPAPVDDTPHLKKRLEKDRFQGNQQR
jgi:hypothetical protein